MCPDAAGCHGDCSEDLHKYSPREPATFRRIINTGSVFARRCHKLQRRRLEWQAAALVAATVKVRLIFLAN